MNTQVFICSNCNLELSDGKQAAEHLKVVHGIKNTQGTRTMILHIDGSNFYESQYEWIIGDVKLVEVCHNERKPRGGDHGQPSTSQACPGPA
jgi:hypothetical protein